jgi:hypothetical protein
MVRTRKYYLKNNYLTLRSKVKAPQRSLRYATHRLVVMHPHTKYNWPIWKDKKLWSRQAWLSSSSYITLYSHRCNRNLHTFCLLWRHSQPGQWDNFIQLITVIQSCRMWIRWFYMKRCGCQLCVCWLSEY